MWLVSLAVAVMLGSVYWAFVNSPAGPERRGDYIAGIAVVTGMALAGLGIYWVLYFGHQRSAEVRDGTLHVRSWLRWSGFGTDRSIHLRDVRRAVLVRPYYAEFQIAGASTRVWTMYRTLHDVDRFGTFWWRPADYDALAARLREEGIEVEFRHVSGLLSEVTAR